MKLFEMSTRDMARTLCSLTQPFANLCDDREVAQAMMALSNGMQGKGTGTLADIVARSVPVLLDRHYDDVVAILSALTGKTVEEINAQPGTETIADIRAVMDGDLTSFFSLSAPTGDRPSSQPSTPTAHRQASTRWRHFWSGRPNKRSARSTSRR